VKVYKVFKVAKVVVHPNYQRQQIVIPIEHEGAQAEQRKMPSGDPSPLSEGIRNDFTRGDFL
jgi:uncharacterized protein (UPF0248 family)